MPQHYQDPEVVAKIIKKDSLNSSDNLSCSIPNKIDKGIYYCPVATWSCLSSAAGEGSLPVLLI